MTDGKKGISRQDLQNSGNMKILQYSLVYDENNYNISKEVFSNWAVNNFGASYKHGSNQIKPNINTPGTNNFGINPKQNFGTFYDSGGQSRTVYGNDVLNTIGALKNAIDGKVTTFRGHDDKTYVIRNGRFISQSGANKGEAVNINTIINSLKINNLPGIYDYLKPAKRDLVDINFINFNNDRDGDGIPNSIDREPDNPNN